MSANNQMVVRKIRKHWCTFMEINGSVEGNPYTDPEAAQSLFFKKFEKKLNAVEYANRVCQEEIVEYGMRIDKEEGEEKK